MRRLRLMPVVALCLSVLLSACAKVPARTAQPDSGAPAAGAGSVVSVKVLAPFSDSSLDALISAFYAKYPNYRVEKVTVPQSGNYQERLAQMKAKVASGEVDVVPTAQLNPADFVKENLLLGLDPYIQKNSFDLKPFGPGIEAMRFDGKLYDLPYAIHPWILLYNGDMFTASGVTPPKAGWTWDEFRETARQLTKEGSQKVWGFAAPWPEHLARMYLVQRGGDLWMEDEKAMKDTLQFFDSLIFADKVMPPAQKREAGSMVPYLEDFRQGKAAMTAENLQSLQFMGGGFNFQWDMAPIPSLPGTKGAALAQPVTYGIAAASKQQEAAWQFVAFATGAEGAAALAKVGVLPMYSSPEVEKAWFDRTPAPPPGSEFLFATPWAVMSRSGEFNEQLAQVMVTSLTDGLSGARPWEDVHADFAREVERIRNEKE